MVSYQRSAHLKRCAPAIRRAIDNGEFFRGTQDLELGQALGVALWEQYGHTLAAKQPQSMAELESTTGSHVRVDPRVIAEVDRKKPIGVTRTGWVNLLLQKAIASEPEPLARD